MIVPVIMAGGVGSRLWPLSRKDRPKQFLRLHGENTMLQESIKRLDRLETTPPLVVCNESHRYLVAEQLREVGIESFKIILEPFSRNTAPAVALAALEALDSFDDPSLLVLSADHIIEDTSAFLRAVHEGFSLVQRNKLVTFGVVPNRAETGYGYIEKIRNETTSAVASFVEKPNAAEAKKYVESGGFLWNSGIFMFKARQYLDELSIHRPDIYGICVSSFSKSKSEGVFRSIEPSRFESCPSESIDYAVLESSQDIWVVSLNAGWSDIGNWTALKDANTTDDFDNVFIGDVVAADVRNSIFHSENKLTVALGIQDMVVVDTPDVLFLAPSEQAHEVKSLVQMLKETGRSESENHAEVHRPWGKFVSLSAGENYQVKRITVFVGQKLSLQKHRYRAEHWVVVSGTARVTKDKQELVLNENDSIYLPAECVHRLENIGKVPLEVVEIQLGSYLGEDDIIRISDTYGRK